MSIQIRIFLGYLQNKELKIHLDQSICWHEAKTLGLATLTETNWQEKDYIGLFIPSRLNCHQIKEKEQEIKSQLQVYCPKLNLDKHSSYLFSQLFLL
jgi:hypothetical protein